MPTVLPSGLILTRPLRGFSGLTTCRDIMKPLKIISSCFASILAIASAHGSSFTFDHSVGVAVPDDTSLGIQNTRTITDPLGIITGTSVQLRLSPLGNDGGWLGDIYAYLRH